MQNAPMSLARELRQFRDFALKGNVVDLAFAVIIGGAFGKIVDWLVKDIIMPMIGVVGSADFSNYFLPLSHNVTATNLADAQKQGAVLAWGSFMTYVVNFLIVAVVLFLICPADPVPAPRTAAGRRRCRPRRPRKRCCSTEIRDLLARR